MKPYYVYMLKCSDASYYIGVTNDVERRLSEHNLSLIKNSYTSTRLPVELIFNVEFNDIRHAIAFEKQIKGWSRAKKEALIRGDWNLISLLAKSKMKSITEKS